MQVKELQMAQATLEAGGVIRRQTIQRDGPDFWKAQRSLISNQDRFSAV